MIQDINRHIEIANNAIAWAKEHGKDSFHYDSFKAYRRRLRKIAAALSEKCSAAAYGESQVGKSYLMSSLLSSPKAPFVITHAGKDYSFIDDINPSGGNNSKVESTGVITRFTIKKDNKKSSGLVRVKNLSVVDLVLLLANSYYNDIKINQDTVLRFDDINSELETMSSQWAAQTYEQNEIGEDDIADIADYIHDVIGNNAQGVNQSSFRRIVGPSIKYVPSEKWVDIFGLLWNKNTETSQMFSLLIKEYKKIGFETEICIPFEAVLREKGTLLKIQWLDTVCGMQADLGNDERTTDVYDANGNILACGFDKGFLSALIAEITLEVPECLAEERPFLKQMDLLDFPGARGKEEYKEEEIHTVLPTLLRRGKVAYLFNKYSRSLRMSSVLFCFHNDQKAAPIGGTISSWIEDTVGKTPEERTAMLNNTKGISPLFLIATKFNMDLERVKTDNCENTDKLSEHWKRFKDVLPEIVKPSQWLNEWVKPTGIFKTATFQNIYPLRDFYWSGKNGVFDGYSDGAIKQEETQVHQFADYPDYFEKLRESFLRNEFVKKHFSNPEKTWDEVATPNNDGSKAIIRDLGTIANVLDKARRKKYRAELEQIKEEMYQAMVVYYEPDAQEDKNMKVKQIASDIKRSLYLNVGSRPEVFGKIIDTLMVPAGKLRDIAYNIIICHSEMPKDFSIINFIRKQANVDLAEEKAANINKLCDFFNCTEAELEKDLREKGCSIADVLESETDIQTTVAGIVAKRITEYWDSYISEQTSTLQALLPHADELILMLSKLLHKHNVNKLMQKQIDTYCRMFGQNEQPNVIADYAALTLNNFVSNIGREYLNETEIDNIKAKAEKCQIKADLTVEAWKTENHPTPLEETLKAFDEAADIDRVKTETLMKLPLWENFSRWENLVTIGLLYASDISNTDPKANAKIKRLLDDCESLYQQQA